MNELKSKPFLMVIESVSSLKDFLSKAKSLPKLEGDIEGAVVSGEVKQGRISIGDSLLVSGQNVVGKVIGILNFGMLMDEAVVGDSVNILIGDILPEQIKIGDQLCQKI